MPSCVSRTVMAFRGRMWSQCFRADGAARIQRVQDQRWQGEVVHPVNPVSHVELILVVTVNFDQHLHIERVRLCGEPGDERERLRNHEAAGARLLDCEADCIEPNRADAGAVQTMENAGEVPLRFGMRHVDVDLIAREGGPQEKPVPSRSLVGSEGKARARCVQRQ